MSARAPSLILRATLGFALVALLAVGGAGAFLYHSLERTVLERADYALLGRLAHFRSLLSTDLSLETLGHSPQLFANMLGNEQDVFLIGAPGAKPVIASNPLQIALPDLPVIPQTRRPTRADLREGQLADGTRWRAARVAVNTPEGPVELTAAHVLRNEDTTLADFRLGLIGAVTLAFLATAGLGYLLLRRGLAPLRRIARHAGGITPTRLAAPLELADAPRELQPLVENYNAMLARLADGYGRLVQFSADLAHEIRTPINALMGHTEVALRQVRGTEEYQTLLESNLEELERISRLVESILFLARADDAQAVLAPQPLELAEELARIADYFEGPADERGLRIVVAGSGQVVADPLLLRRALSNLVANAIRYAEPDGEIRLQADGGRIRVSNAGPSLAPEHLQRLFDRFYRADPSRHQPHDSNGLGLAIVAAIMRLHGGRAEVEQDARGIHFSLVFPTAVA
ncbi:histidine kinase [Pseudomonas oryzihabitans]|nr:histidine kinase [Pseudomonas psychrotolerans]